MTLFKLVEYHYNSAIELQHELEKQMEEFNKLHNNSNPICMKYGNKLHLVVKATPYQWSRYLHREFIHKFRVCLLEVYMGFDGEDIFC